MAESKEPGEGAGKPIEEDRLEAVEALHARARALLAEGDLAGAKRDLEGAREILVDSLGTEDHPDVAATLHALGVVEEAAGNPTAAIAAYRRALEIEERVYGGLDQFQSAETEVELGRTLIEGGQAEEARKLLEHAAGVFEKDVPEHPALEGARFMVDTGLSIRTVKVAQAAIEANASGEAPPEALLSVVEALDRLPEPHGAVGSFLGRLARGETPQLPEGLEPPVQTFLARVAAAADAAVAVDVGSIVRGALEARRTGGELPSDAAGHLESLAAAGAPHDAVAEALRRVAAGESLEPVPEDLPEDVASFLGEVLEAAAQIDAKASDGRAG